GSADAIAVLLQKDAHPVALLHGVALFEERIAKHPGEMMVVANERFILEKVGFELGQRDFLESVGIGVGAHVEVQMGIRMIADEVAGPIPGGDQLLPGTTIRPLAADEQD